MSGPELTPGLADDELVLGWRDSEWTGIAPTLEEDVAFSSIAQNEIGHAPRRCTQLRWPAAPRPRVRPRAAASAARRSSSCASRLGAHDRAPVALRGGGRDPHRRAQWSDPPRRLAAKIDREERYHRMHAEMWRDRLRDEPRFRDAVDELWPYALGVLPPGCAATLAGSRG